MIQKQLSMIKNLQLYLFNLNKHELRFRLPSFVAIIALIVLPANGFSSSTCIFHNLTGIPCPLCGLTRSMSSLLDFNFSQSFSYHPLGAIILIFLVICVITNQPDYLKTHVKMGRIFFSARFLFLLFTVTWISRIINF